MLVFDYECSICSSSSSEFRETSEDTTNSLNPCNSCHVSMKKVYSATYGYVKNTKNPTKVKR